MNSFVLIFTFLLSFFFGGDRTGNACDRTFDRPDAIVRSSDNDATDSKADLNDMAILPARTALYSGGGNSFAPSVRSTNSGRRVQPSAKSAFRIIKGGKVFDRNNLYTFLATILQFLSGIRSNSRYIYSICQLLI